MASHGFKVHAGDFAEGSNGIIMFGQLVLVKKRGLVFDKKESMPDSELEVVEIVTEESVKKIAGAVAWGLVGTALLGPLGLFGGLLLGGKSKEITFVARLRDGRSFLATTDPPTYKLFLKASMKHPKKG